jgi:signal transduction histidine kinase
VLVNDILDFSKIEAGKMSLEVADVELHSLIADVITLTSEAAKKKGLILRVQLAPDIPAELAAIRFACDKFSSIWSVTRSSSPIRV